MHHVREPFHVHQLGDVNRSGDADPADVVSAQVHQHDVLGPLFFAVLQFSLKSVVLLWGFAPGAGSSYRMRCGDTILNLYHCFDGRADDLESVQVKVVHVRRWVDAAQGPVHLERVSLGLPGEPLGVDYLDNVPGIDVLNTLFHYIVVLVFGEVGRCFHRC